MKVYKGVIATILAGFMCAGLSACEKEGPAGKAVDDAASDVANEANEAKKAVEKKMEE